MLILTRKLGEQIAIGDDITITVLDIKGKQARIGIEAPSALPVHRGEIYLLIEEENLRAADLAPAGLADAWKKMQAKTEK